MTLEKPPLRILGIDPGTATVGYSVVDLRGRDSFELAGVGTIHTPKGLAAGERLAIIRADILSLIDEYRPDVMPVESIFFFKNAKTAIPVAQARGVIIEAAACRGVAVAEYTPMQVKLNLTGFGRADKKMVQLMVSRLLRIEGLIRPDDAADAVAIAICHARMMPSFSQAG